MELPVSSHHPIFQHNYGSSLTHASGKKIPYDNTCNDGIFNATAAGGESSATDYSYGAAGVSSSIGSAPSNLASTLHASFEGVAGTGCLFRRASAQVSTDDSRGGFCTHVPWASVKGDDGGVDMKVACNLLIPCMSLRNKYKMINKGRQEKVSEEKISRPVTWKFVNGIMCFQGRQTVMPGLDEFYRDMQLLSLCAEDMRCAVAAQGRLEVLEEKYMVFELVNSTAEKDGEYQKGSGLYDSTVRIDNYVNGETSMNSFEVLCYIQNTIAKRGNEVVRLVGENCEPQTLRKLCEVLDIHDPESQLSVKQLGLRFLGEARDSIAQVSFLDPKLNKAYCFGAELLPVFLKRNEIANGMFFAELLRNVLERNAKPGPYNPECTEMAFEISWCHPKQSFEDFSKWVLSQDLNKYETSNMFMLTVRRSSVSEEANMHKDIENRKKSSNSDLTNALATSEKNHYIMDFLNHSSTGVLNSISPNVKTPETTTLLDEFEEFFLPLLGATVAPEDSQNADLASLLNHVGAFVLVLPETESQQEKGGKVLTETTIVEEAAADGSILKNGNKDVAGENAFYTLHSGWLFLYLFWANLVSLNTIRTKLDLNTFQLRFLPSSNTGARNDFLTSYLLCDVLLQNVSGLAEEPVLQYLFGLHQIPFTMSPLCCNAVRCSLFKEHPFCNFFRRGLHVSLCTCHPLLCHHSANPLLEEYATTGKLFRLNSVDIAEVSRNSVLMSCFPENMKKKWLGERYMEGASGNVYSLSKVRTSRLHLRQDNWDEELSIIYNCIQSDEVMKNVISGVNGTILNSNRSYNGRSVASSHSVSDNKTIFLHPHLPEEAHPGNSAVTRKSFYESLEGMRSNQDRLLHMAGEIRKELVSMFDPNYLHSTPAQLSISSQKSVTWTDKVEMKKRKVTCLREIASEEKLATEGAGTTPLVTAEQDSQLNELHPPTSFSNEISMNKISPSMLEMFSPAFNPDHASMLSFVSFLPQPFMFLSAVRQSSSFDGSCNCIGSISISSEGEGRVDGVSGSNFIEALPARAPTGRLLLPFSHSLRRETCARGPGAEEGRRKTVFFPRVILTAPFERDSKMVFVAQMLHRAMELRKAYIADKVDIVAELTVASGVRIENAFNAAASSISGGGAMGSTIVGMGGVSSAFYNENEWMYSTVDGIIVAHEVRQIPRLPTKMFRFEEFKRDILELKSIVDNVKVNEHCAKRLQLLKHKFRLHSVINLSREAGRTKTKASNNRDVYQTTKVDTNVTVERGATSRCLLNFIVSKVINNGEDVINLGDRDAAPQTLRQLIKEMNIDPESLTVDDLALQENICAGDGRGSSAIALTPEANSKLLTLVLKTQNPLKGRYFAELIKQAFADLARDDYAFAESRLRIYGSCMNEWDDLAYWFETHEINNKRSQWVAQIPRIYGYLRKKEKVKSFAEYLENIFAPLWGVSLHPSLNPRLFHFVGHISAFDSVGNEQLETNIPLSLVSKPPEEWTSVEEPPYNYYLYCLWANIVSLNEFRARREFSTFSFRPTCGGNFTGSLEQLLGGFLCAHAINNGVMLKDSSALQYLYYLAQVGISVSPLSNISQNISYLKNPFPDFFRCGLHVSLGTDQPLHFHHTHEPLIEEYSIAVKVWKLSANDYCEIARNSVKQSGFDSEFKRKRLGNLYFLNSSRGNDENKTHLSDIRLSYRWETYHAEIAELERLSGMKFNRAYMTSDEESKNIRLAETYLQEIEKQQRALGEDRDEMSAEFREQKAAMVAATRKAERQELVARRNLLKKYVNEFGANYQGLLKQNSDLKEILSRELVKEKQIERLRKIYKTIVDVEEENMS